MFNRLRGKLPDSHDLAEIDPSELPLEALSKFEQMLIEAAKAEGERPSTENLPDDGTLVVRHAIRGPATFCTDRRFRPIQGLRCNGDVATPLLVEEPTERKAHA